MSTPAGMKAEKTGQAGLFIDNFKFVSCLQ
jgi:hypothetical protein